MAGCSPTQLLPESDSFLAVVQEFQRNVALALLGVFVVIVILIPSPGHAALTVVSSKQDVWLKLSVATSSNTNKIISVRAVCSGGWNGLLDYNVHNSGGGWILALVGPLPGQYHGAAKRF